MATPSTAEVPLRTATAFLVAAKTVRGLERESGVGWAASDVYKRQVKRQRWPPLLAAL